MELSHAQKSTGVVCANYRMDAESLERGIERAISNTLSRIVRGDHQEQSAGQGETRPHGAINEVGTEELTLPTVRHSTPLTPSRDNLGRNQPQRR